MATPAIAVLAAVPAFAARNTETAAWDTAMRTYEQALANRKAYAPTFDKICEAYAAGRPSTDSIHWDEFPMRHRDTVARVMDLEKEWREYLDGEGKWWNATDPEASKARRRAALDSVQAFREAEARNCRDTGMDIAIDRSDVLDDAEYDAEKALMQMEAPDLAALKWKLDRIFELDGDNGMQPWTAVFVGQTITDYRRLLGEARS